MKKVTTILLFFIIFIAASGQGLSSVMDMPYPNAVKYLPAPPDSLSMAFAYDVHQYMYYKGLRDSERGQQALTDVSYGSPYIANRMQDIFGLLASSPNYPNIRELLYTSLNYIAQSCGAAKSYYNRRRPFDRFNDPIFGSETRNELLKTGSYPSAHSMCGWAAALVLAEINPKVQDELFDSGYEYGQSRLIIGAHWQSDVDAARLMTSANFARLHANEEYLAAVDKAQADYDEITLNTRPTALDQLHPLVEFLPEMPDSTGPAYASDVTAFYAGKQQRTASRSQQAIADADISVTGISNAFSSILGIDITASGTPKIYQLLETGINQAISNCDNLQATQYRRAPYDRLRETPLLGTVSMTALSCYPSEHATVGWLSALLLMDICPTYQNTILKRGYDYGESRVIAGTNWQSDVEAGQLLGGMVFANMMSDPSMRALLTQAREEFNNISSISTVTVEAPDTLPTSYTLDGRIAMPDSHGVIVSSDGKKIMR